MLFEVGLVGDGQQLRDFIQVRDVARADVAAVRAGEPGTARAFTIGSGSRTRSVRWPGCRPVRSAGQRPG